MPLCPPLQPVGNGCRRGAVDKVFENSEPDAVQVAVGNCNYVAEYTGYAGRVFEKAVAPSQCSATKWKSPAVGCVKINMDAHLGENNMAALGVVFRDHDGQLILTATRRVPLSSPECVEAQTIRYALLMAKRFGYRKISV
uniref:RNase H type-1 domain-containing protein n=1 Tax=Chenopodium quinoa TaxID=63459 RepID=A0A803MYJ6_CHEQI